MIQIQSLEIREFRGIRDLTLSLGRKTFIVVGPNGSGKSGIVDAIQFVLTGEIGRLQGRGTGDLRLAEHGPHVDRRQEPDAATVKMSVFLPDLNEEATIARSVGRPRDPTITPDTDRVKAVFAELGRHPEITLSRRELIRLILAEATKRSQDVQTLLQLRGIDATRQALKTALNKLGIEAGTARDRVQAAKANLARALDVKVANEPAILATVNARRGVLGLELIGAVTVQTDLSAGIKMPDSGRGGGGVAGKATAAADVRALWTALERAQDRSVKAAEYIRPRLDRLDREPGALQHAKRQAFLESGLALVDGPACPLCDAEWDVEALRRHVKEKLDYAKDAGVLAAELNAAGRTVARDAHQLRLVCESVLKLPEALEAKAFVAWCNSVETLAGSLDSLDRVVVSRDRLLNGWGIAPSAVVDELKALDGRLQSRPDRGAAAEATAFLAVAQERLRDLREAEKWEREAGASHGRARQAYRAFCDVSREVLLELYREVQVDFAAYYRTLNDDDEGQFEAEFTPEEGKLDLRVDFHGKGKFPPGAFHSEGHQDGMGLCLYLALLKKVLAERFTVGVLDDVVMSVDSQHRRKVCRLLKREFPKTQFVITTHDEVWARQMRSEALVDGRGTLAFYSWTVDAGPLVSGVVDVWRRVEEELARNDVTAAAFQLRRHCEYVARELAHVLQAKVAFKADGAYEPGALLDAVLARYADLTKTAAKAARSWAQADKLEEVGARQERWASWQKEFAAERWTLNKLVHYNEWVQMTADEFRMVVTALRGLLGELRCGKQACDSWLYLDSPIDAKSLRCDCGAVWLNLVEK